MTVKEMVLMAAREMGVYEDVVQYVEGLSDIGEDAAEMLLNAYNIVENELALDYFPLYDEETLSSGDGKILYTQFSHTPVRVIKILDKNDVEVQFSLYADYVLTVKGLAKVHYAYAPTPKTMMGVVEVTPPVSERLILYGMLFQYCTSTGKYEQAALWDAKYKAGIVATYRMGKGTRIQQKRWWV